MATGLQLAIAAGALIGLGAAFLIWRLVPADPDLREALGRLTPQTRPHTTGLRGDASDPNDTVDARDRVGMWGMKTLPAGTWGTVPTKELAIMRIPLSRFYGEKILYALLGSLIPPVMTALFTVLGFGPPVVVPVIASLVLALVLFFLPDYNVRDDAKKARVEFSRALGAYIDFVALERRGGAGARQAMEVSAEVGDSWVFRRLGEELARTRWSGVTPWDALRGLGEELGLPELDELADIMRLSGEEDAQIYTNLRAKSASMRAAMLATEKGKANEIGERMSIPMSLLGIIFLAILVAPALLRVLEGT